MPRKKSATTAAATGMTWSEFKRKWSRYTGKESSAYVVPSSVVGGAGVSPAVVKQKKAGETPAPPDQIGLARYPRLVPKDADSAGKLKKRTLTNLYNERPTWLDMAHKKLDTAVAAAYGWPVDLTDEQILERLLKLNLERAAAEAKSAQTKKPKTSRAKHADEML